MTPEQLQMDQKDGFKVICNKCGTQQSFASGDVDVFSLNNISVMSVQGRALIECKTCQTISDLDAY